MGTLRQRFQSKVEQFSGRAKKATGEATGDRELEARGQGQQAKGDIRGKAAEAGERLKAAGDKAAGSIREAFGRATGSREQERKGEVQKAEGEARDKSAE